MGATRDRILVVEDGAETIALLRALLSKLYDVSFVSTCSEAARILQGEFFDAFIIDLLLPDGSGFDVCRALQDRGLADRPIILLTAQTGISQKSQGFEMGVEDFVSKPFDPSELLIRLAARIRKSKARETQSGELRAGNLVFDLGMQRVERKNSNRVIQETLDLTSLEYRLLLFMVRRRNQTATREEMIEAAWGPGVHVLQRTIDTHICNIRKKLKPSGYTIRAVYGSGYRFSALRGSPHVH